MIHDSDRSGPPEFAGSLATIASPPPRFSEPDIRHLLRDLYGLEGDLKALVSERDQNTRVTTRAGDQFVLKIANAAEDHVVTDFQIKALLHLQDCSRGFGVPKIIRTLTGDAASKIANERSEHVVRLVSYLPGIPCAHVKPSVGLARSLGECLAHLGIALHDFEHPGDRQVLLWDMQRASDLRDLIQYVAEPDLQMAIDRCLDDYEKNALPQFKTLRTQVIHNDLNPGNALVDENDDCRVAGIIDFGDMVHAPLIVDVAIAASYLRAAGENFLALVAPFVAAYDRIAKLEEIELELLFDLMRTRLVTTITLLRWRLSVRGEDDQYSRDAMRAEHNAERFLWRLNSVSAADFAQRIMQACGR